MTTTTNQVDSGRAGSERSRKGDRGNDRSARTGLGFSTDRLPPQSLEAEMSLLGSMMLSRDAVGDVIPLINQKEAHWFYRPDHQLLFEMLIDLYDQNHPIDLVVVRNELERRGILEEVGGTEYIVACVESVPTHVNARHYARIVRDKGMLRELIACAGRIAEDAFTGGDHASEIFERAESELFRVTERRVSGQVDAIGQLVSELAGVIDSQDGGYTGVASGFLELDECTSGFQPGDFIVIAGRPSMGKTAFGLNIAEHMAVTENLPVAFFSLEMSKSQVAQRLLCGAQKIDMHRFRKRMLTSDERERLHFGCGNFYDVPMYIDDTPSMTLLELRTKARRLYQQKNIGAVFVDYLQLMRAPGTESRQQEISTISGGLKALGRELNIPIVALAQLNRMVEGREGHRPRMSDLRESGAIEQDADVILLLHREEYYKKDDPTIRNQAEVIVAKQRNGPTDVIKVHFDNRFTRFSNLSHVPDPGYADPGNDIAPF